MVNTTGPIDCACVIHGDTYSWTYVERLYNMLTRNISPGIRFHVYTEADRPVPAPMIKHELIDLGISGPKHGWWYKLQLFNAQYHAGPLLYFDLDTVIVGNIDWIWHKPLKFFWTINDFKYLWRTQHQGINSSIMWWNTQEFDHVWRNFKQKNIQDLIKSHKGDQDYLNLAINQNLVRFLEPENIKSWRWQCQDGGYDFKTRRFLQPGTGTQITDSTSVLVFHGRPKPAEISDPIVIQHWQ